MFCFHLWKITDINFEVQSKDYNNLYFDVYTKKCRFCSKTKKILVPFIAVKCKVNLNNDLIISGLINKKYI